MMNLNWLKNKLKLDDEVSWGTHTLTKDGTNILSVNKHKCELICLYPLDADEQKLVIDFYNQPASEWLSEGRYNVMATVYAYENKVLYWTHDRNSSFGVEEYGMQAVDQNSLYLDQFVFSKHDIEGLKRSLVNRYKCMVDINAVFNQIDAGTVPVDWRLEK